MSYFDSHKFYEHFSIFMSDDFFLIRRVFIYDLLEYEDRNKFFLSLNNVFPYEFLLFIRKVKKYYRFEQLDNFLKKCILELSLKFDVSCCEIYLSRKILKETRFLLENKLKNKFKEEKIQFNYILNKKMTSGMKIFYSYKVFDLSFDGILNCIRNKIIERIKK